MASSKYFIKVKTPYNVPVLNINEFYKLELFRSEFGIGSLYIDLPMKEHLVHNISTDWRLEVYRRTAGSELVRVGDTQWIVKLVRYKTDEQNESQLHILAYDPMYVIDNRIVAYPEGTPYASKIDMPADDMLKAIVRENFGSLATDYHRDLSEWLVVEEDISAAPPVSKSEFSFQKVMPVLNDICQLSESAGTYLSYDVVYDENSGKLVFKTFTHQRGANRGSSSTAPIYLAHHTDPVNVMGSGINYASVEIDATDEKSYIYSGRQSKEVNAILGEIDNRLAIETGPFARTEDFITTGESVEYNDIMTEAHAWLQHKYRNLILNVHIQETNSLQFGVDYGFGDILAFRYLGTTIDIHLDEFKVIVDGNGKETLSVISTDTEKELLVPPLTGLDALPIIHNEPIEDDESRGATLFYKYHTVAQSFKYGSDVSIDYAKVMMRRSGIPERGVQLSIRADIGGEAPGAIIASAPVKKYETFADGLYTWARFKFDTPVDITAGQTYWISLTCGIAKEEYENYYLVGVDRETRYHDGVMRVSEDGKTFVQFTKYTASDEEWVGAGVDIPFQTYKNGLVEQHQTVDGYVVIDRLTTTAAQQILLPATTITNVRLNIKKFGSPGDFTVCLRKWDYVNNAPGEQISCIYIESKFIETTSFNWHDFTFPAPVNLDAGQLYCITMKAETYGTGNYYHIAADTNHGYSPGGAYTLFGGVWSPVPEDISFAMYQLLPDISFTTMTEENQLDVGKRNSSILQTFQVKTNSRLFRFSTYIAKVGTPDDLSVSIYEMENDEPHKMIATSYLSSEYVSTSFGWRNGSFNGPELSPEKIYCLRFSCSKDENNYYMFKCDSNMSYPDGVAMVKTNEAATADSDMLFRIGQTAQ